MEGLDPTPSLLVTMADREDAVGVERDSGTGRLTGTRVYSRRVAKRAKIVINTKSATRRFSLRNHLSASHNCTAGNLVNSIDAPPLARLRSRGDRNEMEYSSGKTPFGSIYLIVRRIYPCRLTRHRHTAAPTFKPVC